MGLSKRYSTKTRKAKAAAASEIIDDPIITTKECQGYLEKYGLDDQRITTFRNSLVGIVDSILNSYIEEFE